MSTPIAHPHACPDCGQEAAIAVRGKWGEWNLLECLCPDGHYWAVDMKRRVRLLTFGCRLDPKTGERRSEAPLDYTERWKTDQLDKADTLSFELGTRGQRILTRWSTVKGREP